MITPQEIIQKTARHYLPFLRSKLTGEPYLLQVCTYFLHHPQPGLYIRELPIPVHTKFIEETSASLRQLLDIVLPAAAIHSAETAFERRFGWRVDEPLLRLR